MLTWLKKMVLEKWAGRAIVMLLTLLSGYLAQAGVPEAVAAGWVEATRKLLEVVVPLLIAWLLGMARQKVALMTPPPGR